MSKRVTRQDIFQRAAARLREEFRELTSVPHSGVKGSEGEKLFRQFLNDHLPKRFFAGAGFVLDRADAVSPQTDVVIYDALNCPVYRASDDAGIFPSDNVAAIVEVKSRLDKDRLREAVSAVQEVKALKKTPVPDLPFLVRTETLGCIFAYESAITLEKVRDHYCDFVQGTDLMHQVDFIVVLDRGIVSWLTRIPQRSSWSQSFLGDAGGTAGEGAHLALGVSESGEDTLDAFLRLLLAHLSYFRGLVDHPGFDWQTMKSGGQVSLRYVTSITGERDPTKRDEVLHRYAQEARILLTGKAG